MMNFNTQGTFRNAVSGPLDYRPPLRAENNMTYLDLVRTIKFLWSEIHPDVPVVPEGSQAFAKTPCVVRSLEVRTPFVGEAKTKVRENITDPDNNEFYQIKAQKFNNTILFTAVTENDPDLCEQIIETFEDFIHQVTPALKQYGVSDIKYVRRTPDSDQPRRGEDATTRAVAFNFVLEKVYQTKFSRIEEIIINVSTFLNSTSDYFFVPPSGSDHIEIEAVNWFQEGQAVIVHYIPNRNKLLPVELNSGHVYRVSSVDGMKIYLETLDGDPITFAAGGEGHVNHWRTNSFKFDLDENLATPDY